MLPPVWCSASWADTTLHGEKLRATSKQGWTQLTWRPKEEDISVTGRLNWLEWRESLWVSLRQGCFLRLIRLQMLWSNNHVNRFIWLHTWQVYCWWIEQVSRQHVVGGCTLGIYRETLWIVDVRSFQSLNQSIHFIFINSPNKNNGLTFKSSWFTEVLPVMYRTPKTLQYSGNYHWAADQETNPSERIN